MKKVILTLGIFVAFGVNAQMVIKEQVKDSVVWQATKLSAVPKLMFFSSGDIKSYTFYYQNAKYSTITDIDYITLGSKDDALKFFELLSEVVANDTEYTVQLDGKMWLIAKSMGNGVSVFSEFSYFYLNGKQLSGVLDKLKQ